jgi:hypothetical protein
VDAKQLAKLIRKNAAKAEKLAKARQGKAYDQTIDATAPAEPATDDAAVERDHFFKEMKRREF